MGIVIPDKPFILEDINPSFLKKYSLLPISLENDILKILKSENTSLEGISIAIRHFPYETDFVDYDEDEIQRLIYKWYEAQSQTDEEEFDIESLIEDPSQLRDIAQEAPIIRLVNNYINYAMEAGASDIHLEPTKKTFDVRYRIDGVLYLQDQLSKKIQPAVTSRIKLMSKMDIAEVRLPQDGRIKNKYDDVEVDIRVSSIPTIHGESLVLRILNKESVSLKFDALGMDDKHTSVFKDLISRPYGIILVTGPTGAGKTTTLYTAIDNITKDDKKIITVEDPVEYQLEGINQIQVNQKIGLTFANTLRSILRQDPDVILIGEIRDTETAEIAVQASLTGHLVFSTLHTNDAAGAITRLIDMGIEPYLISSSLISVIGQRLVRKICEHCKEKIIHTKKEIDAIKSSLGLNGDLEIPYSYKGKGCPKCANTGYRGRSAIYEMMIIDEDIKREIIISKNSDSIKKAAIQNGMREMRQDGIKKVLEGITTIEEILRVLH